MKVPYVFDGKTWRKVTYCDMERGEGLAKFKVPDGVTLCARVVDRLPDAESALLGDFVILTTTNQSRCWLCSLLSVVMSTLTQWADRMGCAITTKETP